MYMAGIIAAPHKEQTHKEKFSRSNAYVTDATALILATVAIILILTHSCTVFLLTRKNASEFISGQARNAVPACFCT